MIFTEDDVDNSDGQTDLFIEEAYEEFLRRRQEAYRQEIQNLDKEILFEGGETSLCHELEQRYRIDVPVLEEERGVTLDPEEVMIDVSRDPYLSRYQLRNSYVPHTRFVFELPFRGDEALFRVRPSRYWDPPLRGIVSQSTLQLIFDVRNPREEELKKLVSTRLERVKESLEQLRGHFHSYNETLSQSLLACLKERQRKLSEGRQLATSIGFPLKKREAIPETIVFPLQPKPLLLLKSHGKGLSTQPEPALDMQAYEQILDQLTHMALAMERSPHVVAHMQEEDLRFLFLFVLNATYEGQATGETFNMSGKVDILIRVEGRNIFLAECKFWNGPESLKGAIDQLLTYTHWRDSKTAVLVFNRNKNFSTVLSKIPHVVQAHPQYVCQLPSSSETQFRYKFSHPNDPMRELYMTVLAFDIPAP
jgi:hypothetical protein